MASQSVLGSSASLSRPAASVTLLPGLLELVEDGRVLLPAGGEGDKVDLGLLDGKAKHT